MKSGTSEHVKSPVSGNKVAKVPVVLQLESLECGAACLCMVLAYYEKWIPLEIIRNDCGVSRDGSNAASIYKCALKYDLDVEAYNYDVENLRKNATFPCIAFWAGAHFVVIDGIKKNKVILNDPAAGKEVLDINYFRQGYSKIVLLFKPNKNFKPEGKKESVLKFAKQYAKDLKKPIIVLSIITLLASAIGIVTPLISKYFYDSILPKEMEYKDAMPFLISVLGFYLIYFIFQLIKSLYTYRANKKTSREASSRFMKKLLSLPLSFFSQRFKGDVVSRQQASEQVANTIIQIVAPLLINFISLIFYLVIMFLYSWSLSLIGILSVVCNTILSLYISNKRVDEMKSKSRDRSALSGNTISSLEMMETIKSSGAEDGFFNKWKNYLGKSIESNRKANIRSFYLSTIPSIVSSILGTLLVGIGTMYVILGIKSTNGGAFTIGTVTAFQGFYTSFYKPVSDLIKSSQAVSEMRTDMERINDVEKYPNDPNIAPNRDKPYKDLKGDIELRNITFGYARLQDPLFSNLSVHIKPGQKVAFVGNSGCGKSTLSKLISGLYNIWDGEILFDGKPRSEYSRETFTKQLTVVDQDIVLFPDTISNNIKLWNENISDNDVKKASEDAQIVDFVNDKEGKFDHFLKENGADFSGGQRQCIEIARGLAMNPKILILDEATSALDAKTEDAIINAIKKRNMTCILIAHRLSTIRDADQIIVLDKGKIVEVGTHKELLKRNGKYASLVRND